MPAPTVYYEGHIKRDAATNSSALRTIFPEDQGPQLANMAWLVATPNTGARHATTAEVSGWEDRKPLGEHRRLRNVLRDHGLRVAGEAPPVPASRAG